MSNFTEQSLYPYFQTDDPRTQKQTPQSSSTTNTAPSQFRLIQSCIPLSTVPLLNNSNTKTLLVHATNTFGIWGAGFAKALRTLYPSAEQIYKSWCDENRSSPNQWPSRALVGRCLVIPPQEGDAAGGVWIACLFTSHGYGERAIRGGRGGGHAAKDGSGRVVHSTKRALGELMAWVRECEKEGDNYSDEAGDGGKEKKETVEGIKRQEKKKTKMVIYSPKFNSSNFGVDWEVTAGMIREAFVEWDGEWRVLADP